MQPAQQQLHSELPLTDLWTYNGVYPGYTIEARVDEPIEVTYINGLSAGEHLFEVDECAHGPNYYGASRRIVTHLHGGHLPARFDGQPEYSILPGEFDVYEYPNAQLPATLWYHDTMTPQYHYGKVARHHETMIPPMQPWCILSLDSANI